MGIMNKGVIYALWDYEPQNDDELPMKEGDCMTIIRREDEDEIEWWWARLNDKEGYVPRNLLGVRKDFFLNNFYFFNVVSILFYLIVYFWLHWVFIAVRGLFSSCGERGLLFVAVHGLLTAVASFVVEHGL